MHISPFLGLADMEASNMEGEVDETVCLLDQESFIRMVKQHPCLYDSRDPCHKLRASKRRAWNQIASKVFTNWIDLTGCVKDDKGKPLQT